MVAIGEKSPRSESVKFSHLGEGFGGNHRGSSEVTGCKQARKARSKSRLGWRGCAKSEFARAHTLRGPGWGGLRSKRSEVVRGCAQLSAVAAEKEPGRRPAREAHWES